MKTSIYNMGGGLFRAVFWLGLLFGVILQWSLPVVGELITGLFKLAVLSLAKLML